MLVYSMSNLEMYFSGFKDLSFHSHLRYNYKNIENEFTSNIRINCILLKFIRKKVCKEHKKIDPFLRFLL